MTVTRTFNMKVGVGVGAITALSMVGTAITGLALLVTPGAQLAGVVTIVFTAGIVALIGAISIPSKVEITDTELVARGGKLLVERVALKNITSVHKTLNPLASPFAWSLDRVMIKYNGGFLLVSTTDNDGLISAIETACPTLVTADGAAQTA